MGFVSHGFRHRWHELGAHRDSRHNLPGSLGRDAAFHRRFVQPHWPQAVDRLGAVLLALEQGHQLVKPLFGLPQRRLVVTGSDAIRCGKARRQGELSGSRC